ncbi:cerebellar degeneration-related protein 2-like [Centruroides sculpturatus]|uniref:cerebellar degeneration-related protein 2-like n=1 Tax=Centruroides sculpturatus TaxID=218467 RepID=UPI000C6D8F5F|nr:cerebellar degeneration-related protein 2-like [Centruroides sculpturatus]
MSEVKISLDNCAEDDREWYENDLQLAAELGMALLKRNQELENIVYQKQLIIDEQLQEIEVYTLDFLNNDIKSIYCYEFFHFHLVIHFSFSSFQTFPAMLITLQ